ncbi:hypothetical protein IIV25_144R [Invertebrate iridovirus 25]|uniref:Uncharacterized protein n=1 Tax=Invertebrate iridovirus 25 TaxID=1301280 RepID=W8W1L8_9VIRU|nr:hypothetical protein IIV25_144R [Invertebrate iridovirus 25]CCV02162.1 hypothetical protein IIV25_144R [Invertebrate iridovirus 25]
MYKCSSIDGKMNPNTRKCIDNFVIQSKFREMYPEKAKAIQGMTVPSSYCDSIESMVTFADEKIQNQKIKLEQEKKMRESMGAPAKFDKYGKYKY